jgi:hypothetical protein
MHREVEEELVTSEDTLCLACLSKDWKRARKQAVCLSKQKVFQKEEEEWGMSGGDCSEAGVVLMCGAHTKQGEAEVRM